MATIDLTGDDDDCQAGRRGKRRSKGKELAEGEGGQVSEVIVIPDDGEERREACGGHDHKKPTDTTSKSNEGIEDMALDIEASLENNFQGEVLYVREVVTQGSVP